MHRSMIAVIVAGLVAPVQAYAADDAAAQQVERMYDGCRAENGAAGSVVACMERKDKETGQGLEDVYKRLVNGLPPSQVPTLRQSERDWLRYQDQTCKLEKRGAADGSNAARIAWAGCSIRTTLQRTAELRELIPGKVANANTATRSVGNAAGSFVFDSQSVRHAVNSSQVVRLGERISPQELSSRFSGYQVKYQKQSDDFYSSADVSGPDGGFQVDFAGDRRTVIGIISTNRLSRDTDGNSLGDALQKVVGSTSARCAYGRNEEVMCLSKNLKDVWYYFGNEGGRCQMEVKESQRSEIPACARVSAIEIRHYE